MGLRAQQPIETYDRLIMQANYSTSDVEKVLRDQEPDEIIVIVREPFGCVLHHVEPYSNNRHGSRVCGGGHIKFCGMVQSRKAQLLGLD